MPKKPGPPTHQQEPPFAVQVELVEGCNLRCTFCGLNGIRGKDNNFKFMDLTTVKRLCDQIIKHSWNPRIEFAMHGEPSYHPRLGRVLYIFRDRLPDTQLMMTSNGGGFLRRPELIDEALDYLNVLAFDNYESVNIIPKLMKRYKGEHTPINYPEDPKGNPHTRRKVTDHDLVIVEDISKAKSGTHSLLNNHAGSGAPPNNNGKGKRCAKPFREMSVRWDGNVAVCCNDWRGLYKCGNINDTDLHELWNGPAFAAARVKLYHGQRDFGPCDGCDATSYRVGLLPDKKGLVSLPEPGKAEQRAIRQALAGEPYTDPVLRPWEIKK